jgi:hypothetical protein
MSHSEIKGYLSTAKQDITKLRQLFESYIADKSVPLEERWIAFVNAPDDLKLKDSGTDMFDALPDDFIMYDGPIHAERYQTITSKFIVFKIQEVQNKPEDYYRNPEIFLSVNLDELKEEILLKNLSSFEYGW